MIKYIVRLNGKKIAKETPKILSLRFGFNKSQLAKIKDKGKIKGYEIERAE